MKLHDHHKNEHIMSIDKTDTIKRQIPRLSPKLQIIALAAIIVLIGGVAFAAHFLSAVPVSNPVRPERPGTFRPTRMQFDSLGIAEAKLMNFRGELITDGSIAYDDDVTTQVFSPYSGQVTRVFAKTGDVVKKGDPLLEVAAVEFVQAKSSLIAASAQLVLTKAAENRQRELYQSNAGALKDWLQSQSDLATAEGNLQSAKNQLRILGKTSGEISAMERNPQTSTINPDALVMAPVAGTVTQRQVGVGQYLQNASAGAAVPVYTISNLSKVWLIANARETDAPLIRVGQQVEAHVLALPDHVFKAKITWVAPAVDPVTHRVAVRAEISNQETALKPMMFASFSIVTGAQSKAVGVPQSAVVYEGGESHVFVANSDGTLAIRPVRIGRASGEWLEVTSGLAAGEKFVTRGTLFIDRATTGGGR